MMIYLRDIPYFLFVDLKGSRGFFSVFVKADITGMGIAILKPV
jgi:hypothetical protein